MLEIFKNLEKYNYWGRKKEIPVGFLRKKYFEKIDPCIGNSLIKVIVGQRRVGKSYFLRQIIQKLLQRKVNPKNIFYLNKELIAFDDIHTHKDLYELITFTKKKLNIKGKMYIFLDEVQDIVNWEKTVNSLSQDHRHSYELFITGSNSAMLSGELSTLLSGRYVAFEVLPFSYSEYCDFLGLKCGKQSYIEYMRSGALPELFHLQEEEIKRHYISSLRDTIILQDVVKRHKVKNAVLLTNLFMFFTDNIGSLFSVNAIVNYLNTHGQRTNHDTISNYVSYLTQSFIIHEVPRFDVKGKAILSGTKKYYLNDLSFRNYLSSHFEHNLGKRLENSLYLYYRSRGYTVSVGSVTMGEVDFVLNKNKERKYVQVAYTLADNKVASREFAALEQIKDSYEKMVISLDDVSLGNKEGIRHLCAWELPED